MSITGCMYTNLNAQDNPGQNKIFFRCEGEHYLIFDIVLLVGDIILGLLNAFIAFQTKRHLPADKTYRKYHESAVINLTTMMAIILSSISKIIVTMLQAMQYQDGILLLITLHVCFWSYPAIFLLFIPKVRSIYTCACIASNFSYTLL